MAARPIKDVRWAYGGTAITADPVLARREEGFVPGLPPQGDETNFIMHDSGEWIAYLDATQGLTLAKGWITVPAVTVNGGNTTVTIGSVGSVIVSGTQRDTPTGAVFSGFANSTDYFLAYDLTTETILSYTAWDDANAATRVPLYWFKTDGAGLVGAGSRSLVSHRISGLQESITLTVSQQANHKAMFQTLYEAIAAARAIQQGSVLTPRGITIEIIGDVTEPTSLSEPELYDAQRLRFVGRAGGQIGGGAVDARILFDLTSGPLFDMASGTPSMVGWSFENLTFQFSGVAAANVGLLRNTAGTVQKLQFSRCTSFNSSVFIYSTGNINGLEISNSTVLTSDAMIHMAGGNLTDLLIDHVTYDWVGSGPGTVFGGVVAPFGDPVNWRLESNKFGKSLPLGGPAVLARELKEGWIINNWFGCNGNSPIIDLGESPTYNDVEMIWIHDNYLKRVSSPISAEPLVRIRSGNDANLGAPLFIHSNAFVGDDATLSTAAGLFIDSQTPGFLTQVVIHSNSFQRLLYGVVFDGNVGKSVVSGNAINVKNASIVTDSDQSMLVISGNVMGNSGVASTSLNVDSANTIAIGNYHDGSFLVGANAGGFILAASNFGTGGSFAAGIDDVLVVGNRIGGGVTVNAVTDFLAVGNMFYGSALNLDCSAGILANNHIEDTVFNPASGQNIIDGNRFAGTVTLTGNNNAFNGNYVVGAVLLDDGDNGIFNSNYLASTLTMISDATGWVVDGNAIVGVFTHNGVSLAAFTPSPDTIGTNKRG